MVNTGGNVQLEAHSGNFNIDADGVGIGTSSPSTPLHISTNVQAVAQLESSHANGSYAIWAVGGTKFGDVGSKKGVSGSGNTTDFMIASRSSYPLILGTGSTERMRIDSSGRVGIGVTPSAWRSGQDVLQVGNGGISNYTDLVTLVSHNSYHDGTSNKYITSSQEAYQISLSSYDNAMMFQYAASGTAGNAITFSEAMRITSAGSVGINTNSPAATLHTVANSGTTALLTTGASGNNIASFYTSGGSQALTLDSSGNVGIGTSSPSELLHVSEGSSGAGRSSDADTLFLENNGNAGITIGSSTTGSGSVRFADSGGTGRGVLFYDHSSDFMSFHSAGGERMRIDASGNWMLGTTDSSLYTSSTENGLFITSTGQLRNSTNAVSAYLNRTGSDGTIVQFNKDGAAVGSIGVVSADRMYFSTADGLGLQLDKDNNRIVPVGADGSTYNNNVSLGGSSLEFKNFYLSGNATHGTTPSSSDAGVFTEAVGRTTYSRGSGTGGFSHLKFINGNGTVGTVSSSGSATAYNTSSDYRLKENVVAMSGATERLKQLNPSRFNFITDPDKTVDGFLAHEVQDVVPEAITGTKDAMRDEDYEVTPAVLDDDGNVVTEAVMGTRSVPDYQGIDQSKLVPLLVATIQELEARIAALES
jgi:hypothetical protein